MERLQAGDNGEYNEADRAAREALAARAAAEEAQRVMEEARQEAAELREQLTAVEEAVRMVMAASAWNQTTRIGNTTTSFTIDPRRLPVFKGERDMQAVGNFINDLHR